MAMYLKVNKKQVCLGKNKKKQKQKQKMPLRVKKSRDVSVQMVKAIKETLSVLAVFVSV